MIPRVFALLWLVSVFVASAVFAGELARTSFSVDMSEADQLKMGVGVSMLVEETLPAHAQVYATIVDVSVLAGLADELVVARAAASASRTDADRLSRLARQDQSASRKATESAAAIAVADETRVVVAERRIGLEWGPVFASMSRDSLRQLLADITSGDAALVRIDGVSGSEDVPKRGELIDPDGIGEVPLLILGVAALADPRFQGFGLLALARGEVAMKLRPGRVFAATVEEGAETTGVVLTRTALVRVDGSVWAYVHLQGSHFERRQVVDGHQLPTGWFVKQGFNAGEHLVTAGAGSLLALERASETEAVD